MKLVFARETFVAGSITVAAGSYWPGDDPVVKAFPNLFTEDPIGLSYSVQPKPAPVEQATAAPGEKRAVKRGQ
jgi:hypothetical protein